MPASTRWNGCISAERELIDTQHYIPRRNGETGKNILDVVFGVNIRPLLTFNGSRRKRVLGGFFGGSFQVVDVLRRKLLR